MSACMNERFAQLETLTHSALVQLMLAINNHIDFESRWLDGQIFGNPFASIVTDDAIQLEEGELATTMDDDGRLVFIGMFAGVRRVVYERYVPLDETVTLVSINTPEFNDLIEADGRGVNLNSLKIFLCCFTDGDAYVATVERMMGQPAPVDQLKVEQEPVAAIEPVVVFSGEHPRDRFWRYTRYAANAMGVVVGVAVGAYAASVLAKRMIG